MTRKRLVTKYHKLISSIFLTLICLLLANCGFHQLSIQNIPPKLRTIYIDSSSPYDPLIVELQRTLTSLDVHVTNTPQTAPVTLSITHIKLYNEIPPIVYSGNAISYTYSLSIKFELINRNGEPIYGPKTLSVARSLLQNTNQLYTPDATALMNRELTRNMVTLIYDQLTSGNVRSALNKKHHTLRHSDPITYRHHKGKNF